MTENLPAKPTRQAAEAKNRSHAGRVTGKLRIAIARMVWHGDKRADAAAAAGLTDHGLRTALRKPHVLAHLRGELALLREGERPRNVHRLAELRDQDENRNAAVSAIKVLEELADDPRSAVNLTLNIQAGWVIDLSEEGATRRTIDHQAGRGAGIAAPAPRDLPPTITAHPNDPGKNKL